MARSDYREDWVRDFYPGPGPTPRGAFRRAERARQAELTEQYREWGRSQRELTRDTDALAEAFVRSIGRDQARALAQRAKERVELLAEQEPSEAPEIEPPDPHLSMGSIMKIEVPPFDEASHFSTGTGQVSHLSQADAAAGTCNAIGNETVPGTGGWTFAEGAVGFDFHVPPFAGSVLTVWTAPSFHYLWWTDCWLRNASSKGDAGFRIERWNFSPDKLDTTLISIPYPIWSDTSGWTGSSGAGGDVTLPMVATVPVDSDHYYKIWVSCAVSTYGAGDKWWGHGYGYGFIDETVPWFIWIYS
jgi:hypothetical protein